MGAKWKQNLLGEKKQILATNTTRYSQNCIPNSTFPHHYIGLLCRGNNISAWWQIWMLFTHGHTALGHQGGIRRRAARYHSAAAPALWSTRAWRTDTSLPFPVASHLSPWQRLKRLWVSDIYCHRGKKNPQTTKPGKIVTVGCSSGCSALQWSLSETGRCGTSQKCLTWLHGPVSNSKGVTVKRVVTQNRTHQHIDVKTISIEVLYFYCLSLNTYKIFLCWSPVYWY